MSANAPPAQPAAPSRLEDWPAFMTVSEVAAVLRLGRSATYDAIARGQIPSVRFGRKLRVPRGAVAQLAREQLVNAAAERAADQQEHQGGGTARPTTEEA